MRNSVTGYKLLNLLLLVSKTPVPGVTTVRFPNLGQLLVRCSIFPTNRNRSGVGIFANVGPDVLLGQRKLDRNVVLRVSCVHDVRLSKFNMS